VPPPSSDADQLIIELIRSRRAATADEVRRILERMAPAPFDDRPRRVPVQERGLKYLDWTLERRMPSPIYHLVKRVAIEEQWAVGTTEEQYVSDLQVAVRHPAARLVVYERRGGCMAATVTLTSLVLPVERMNLGTLEMLLVVFSADRGTIVSGYQFSESDTVAIPGDALWLR
jgi:hypothetical protein